MFYFALRNVERLLGTRYIREGKKTLVAATDYCPVCFRCFRTKSALTKHEKTCQSDSKVTRHVARDDPNGDKPQLTFKKYNALVPMEVGCNSTMHVL